MYVAEAGNNCIRKIASNGVISTIAGVCSSPAGFSGDGGPASMARLSAPAGGVGPVKRMILSTDLPAAKRGMNALLGSSAGSIRGELESLARKLNVAL